LRGDFFCAPFGGNAAAYRGEQHRCHGEPAWAKWSLKDAAKSGRVSSITLSMKTKVRPGKVEKTLFLVEGHNVVYCWHTLTGFRGAMPLGHHATLAMPDKAGAMRVSTSPFALGMTNPGPFGNPAEGNYQSLAEGAKFTRLNRVPTNWSDQPFADCSEFPTREGFGDMIGVFKKASRKPAWTAAVNTKAGYLWYSLKDPAILPATLFWIANNDRHGAPWLGRVRCLGLEDVCGSFADGLADSVNSNLLTKAGFPTAVTLSPKHATAIPYIQGVVKVPRGFDTVKRVAFAPGKVTFTSASGKAVTTPIFHEFLRGEPIE
jgi:hypothetical protein